MKFSYHKNIQLAAHSLFCLFLSHKKCIIVVVRCFDVTISVKHTSLLYCQFNVFSSWTLGSRKTTSFKIITSKMSPGTYKLKCRVENKEYTAKDIAFKVYDSASTSLTSVSPTRVPINQAVNITITGTGFTDTGMFHCQIYLFIYSLVYSLFLILFTCACRTSVITLHYLINVHEQLLFSEKISRVDTLIRWWTLINFLAKFHGGCLFQCIRLLIFAKLCVILEFKCNVSKCIF